MIDSSNKKQAIFENFSFIKDMEPAFQKMFFNAATSVRLPKGFVIASENDRCTNLALVLSGQVRVYKIAASGREITLYRINSGDSCVFTASCIMSHSRFPAIAEADSDIEAIIIPADIARAWISKSQVWCAFIFGLISKRLVSVITLLEEVAFERLDIRIAAYLVHLAETQGQVDIVLNITHQEIAAELGTSREVVSRTLKTLDAQKLLSVGRKEILIPDVQALYEYAHLKVT
ncbi:MAG: Crp/Fnr family transcriptional regulator [Gammaproteobacteria bacterium]|nr:Crp/Fnr family transcriptional regulator [Gammaproteobacteria bacterium]